MRRDRRLIRIPTADLLAPGRAPTCWRREIARLTTRQKSLARACTWLEEFTRRPRFLLETRPLLGACLAEITAELSRSPAPAPADRGHQVAKGKRSAPKWGGTPAGGEHRLREFHSPARPNRTDIHRPPGATGRQLAPAEGGVSPPMPASHPGNERPTATKRPFSLPLQVTHHLLARLAGHYSSPATGMSSSSPPADAHREANFSPPSSRFGSAPAAPAAGRDDLLPPGDHRAWEERVAERARKRLRRYQAETAVSSRHRALPPPPELSPSPRLEAQWQRPLAAPTLSTEELLALHQSPSARPAAAAPRRGGRTTPPDSRPAPVGARSGDGEGSGREGRALQHKRSRAVSPAGSAAAQTTESEKAPTPPLAQETPPSGARHDGQDYHHLSFSEKRGTPLVDEEGTPLSPDLAPPQLAPTLPSLRSRPVASPTPMAAAAAERNARRETAVTAPDALDDLARKIKQILDEESRRHGIDV